MQGSNYIDRVSEVMHKAWDSQTETILDVAKKMANTIAKKNNVYVFGCSHAGIIAEEVFYRTGGLAILNPIFFPGFALNTRPITMTSQLERVPGIGRILVEEHKLKAGDLLIVHSVSGRNTVPVEMVECARAKGVYTVAITSIAYSKSVTSRAPDGKRLFEVADTVIDNCGIPGDAVMNLEGLPEAIGPTSTAVGTALINAIVIETVENLIAMGIVPPVFMSANLDGGGAHNAKMFEEYADNIFYM